DPGGNCRRPRAFQSPWLHRTGVDRCRSAAGLDDAAWRAASGRVMEKTTQPLRFNPILSTDSYKLTHWWQYPPNTRFIYSYVCSRGGFFDHSEMAGLQYIVKSNFAGKVFTLGDVEEARGFAEKHLGRNSRTFHCEGWKDLYAKYGGVLPLRIKAVK